MRDRNVGIDKLRLVSMYMIVSLHVLGVGGVLNNTVEGTCDYYLLYFIQAALYCCVNCFGLISGYVFVDHDIKLMSILKLWGQVLVYSISISAFIFVISGKYTYSELIKAVFPFLSASYWYFNAYVGLFLVMPLLVFIISKIDRIQFKLLLLMLFVFASVLPTFVRVDIFNISSGYSCNWLIVLFFFGAYCKKFGFDFKVHPIMAFSITLLLILLYKFVMETLSMNLLGYSRFSNLLISYSSPAELLLGIDLLVFFSKERKYGKIETLIINRLSPLAFGVYLIHTHPVLFDRYFKDKFGFIVKDNIVLILLKYTMICIGIFFGCLLLECLRKQFTKWMYLRLKGIKATNLYMNNIDKRFKMIDNVINRR